MFSGHRDLNTDCFVKCVSASGPERAWATPLVPRVYLDGEAGVPASRWASSRVLQVEPRAGGNSTQLAAGLRALPVEGCVFASGGPGLPGC